MMTSLTELLTEYYALLGDLGGEAASRMLPPASDDELNRLKSYVGSEAPDELFEWYQFSAGLDLTDNPWHLRPFALGCPYTIDYTLERLESLREHVFSSPPELFYWPDNPYPIVLDIGAPSALLVECESKQGRVFSCDLRGLDGGYYHESISEFVRASTTILASGGYAIENGAPLTYDSWQVFGFLTGDPPPPHIEV